MVGKKQHSTESIIGKLRQADIMLHEGKSMSEVCKSLGISDATYYKWRKEYGGMQVSQARRLKFLEQENTRLRKAVSNLTLEKLILQEVSQGK